ncbi:Panacea domain-containing protein [Seohaeicola sp. SP36]|uniref:Panacea domain-containing protein n=1 Tax=unclassified Seohaeicola TaxID=2641111 RepID=UPI00237A2E61|nr:MULTISPECIES: Panacea domain-containing protein [unclassified Seohaeicola]MDD9705989.1 Panacea domain-containing protein [Seohaeicola sp. 4SK31]MDD9736277.1 Panacea domain-containing protein [Seohaeicola sp. SP36]
MNYAVPEQVEMKPSLDRIIAALYFVMAEAQRRGRKVSQYDLVKTLFLADRAHLNEWGRPVTYDNYCAMLHGPVPSLAYDLLKGNDKALRDHHLHGVPWKSVPHVNATKHFYPSDGALRPEDFLSPSDIEVLGNSLGVVHSLGFGQIRRLTHEDPAYVDAWREDGGRAAYPMKLGLLFDDPNFEQAATLAEYSSYV